MKQLQEQVDVITTYLAKEKLLSPSFIPMGNNPLKASVSSLPPEAEKEREKAHGLSWSINQLLTPSTRHHLRTGF